MSDNCIFCKIIKGEIPSYKIYEDEHVFAFLDIADDVDGHTLVIPKKHYESIIDIPESDFLSLSKAVKKLASHFVTACGYSGINILQANGKSAGQSVFHLHFHIFPRNTNDGATMWPHNKVATKSLEDMQTKLQLK